MDARLRDGELVVGGDARQRFYDARGYGRSLGGNEIALSRVEAAHLLLRGDLDAVVDDGDRLDVRAFLERVDDDRFGARFLVFLDLRERGFYLSPARDGWVDDPDPVVDFVVYPRGKGPEDGAVAYRIRVLGEREPIAATDLGEHAIAVVDEESEVTYFETDRPAFEGDTDVDLPSGVTGALLTDRAICWDPPEALHDRAFYGQPLGQRDGDSGALQLSLVEAAQLVAAGTLDLPGGYDAVVERGRAVEGDRFDRRLQVYAALRERGVVPKTGFKFGADFRTYATVDTVDELGHSERLVRVVPPEHEFSPRDVSLDVRLAHGVRKEMTVAWPADGDAEFRSVRRLTP